MMTTLKNIGQRISNAVGQMTDRAPHYTAADCNNIHVLLLHLCDFDDKLYQWVLRWIAYPLRNPGAKMDMGLVINGDPGTGKKLFFQQVVAQLVPDSARVMSAASLQQSQFYRRAEGKQLILVDGVFNKANASRLKQLISPNAGTAIGMVPWRGNRKNFVFLSSSYEFLPVIESDPRLCVVEAPPPLAPIFYMSVVEEIKNGGVAAFRDHLIRRIDMTGFNEHTRPPLTSVARAEAA